MRSVITSIIATSHLAAGACEIGKSVSFHLPSISDAKPNMTPYLLVQPLVASHKKMVFSSLPQQGRFRQQVKLASQGLSARASNLPWSSCCFSSTLPSNSTETAAKNVHTSSSSKYGSLDASTGRRTQRPIFVAATRQHVGKTTVSLALMSGLQKRFNKVGFLKPVGQQVRTVDRAVHSAD